MTVFDSLCPLSQLKKTEQYALAWGTLGDGKAKTSDRLNARVWLTYRAYDGDITMEDWRKHVMALKFGKPSDDIEFRWCISQFTAEAYLHCKRGEWKDAEEAIKALASQICMSGTTRWPASVLNWLRTQVLQTYAKHLQGEDVKPHIGWICERWKQAALNFNPLKWPLRVDELKHDVEAMNILLGIGRSIGEVVEIDAPWLGMPQLVKPRNAFESCLIQLGKKYPERALWKR